MSFSGAEFGRQAGVYEKHAAVQADLVRWLIAFAGDDFFTGRGRCLEFGAGTGLWTRELVGKFEEVVATDLLEEMMTVGRERVSAAEWRQADAWAAGEIDSGAGFEMVTSASLLQWAPDPVEAIRGQVGNLCAGGRVLAGFYVKPSLPELGECLQGREVLEWREAEEWRMAFEAAGVRVQRMQFEERVYVYPSVLDFLRQLHGVGSVLGGSLSVGELREVMRSYKERFSAEDGSGRVLATWTFCGVKGVFSG